ncbi:MAG TPA: cytochrome d ubiquinol oxidase subunit II [Terriglobia bacterium]|nr:cytochrome d ubiquinol oxidase subunit II [Terriglobia bacterium]
MDLHVVWFCLLGILLAGYAVLDGFDLGVGILHLLGRTDLDRRHFINAIGPIWDGNEVWLITFGGALFAAFPIAYATIFSGFYTAFMALLFALMFRAVSIEFRSKMTSEHWRWAWDFGFFGSSLLASFLFGVAVGNSMIGIPLDGRGVFTGSIIDLLNPYALMAGVTVVTMFGMHGAIYLFLKLPKGPMHSRVQNWIWHMWGLFLVFYVLGSMYTLVAIPNVVANFQRHPWAAGMVVVNVLAVANIPRSVFLGKPLHAFVSSCLTIVVLVFLFGMALWPNLVTASNDPANSLTIYNAASSPKTLWIMFVITLIGMPFVLSYTVAVYWTFRGRVELGEHSY